MVAFAPTACKHRVSGSLSLPSRGAFHLSLTVLFAIGHQGVFSLGGWSPRLPTGFLVSCGTLDPRPLTHISPTGLLPSPMRLSRRFDYVCFALCRSVTPEVRRPPVWALSRSLAATQEIDVSFSSLPYLDVSVQAVPFHTLWIGVWMTEVFSAGFPHSEISGSMDICSSPKLIAAYHVFHRLSVPRHPPYALCSLTNRFNFEGRKLRPKSSSLDFVRHFRTS